MDAYLILLYRALSDDADLLPPYAAYLLDDAAAFIRRFTLISLFSAADVSRCHGYAADVSRFIATLFAIFLLSLFATGRCYYGFFMLISRFHVISIHAMLSISRVSAIGRLAFSPP